MSLKQSQSMTGEQNRNAKLSDDQFKAIAKSTESVQMLAAKYGVTEEYIRRIKRGTVRRRTK